MVKELSQYNKALAKDINDQLSPAIKEGVTQATPKELTRKLEEDVFLFSGCKATTMMHNAKTILLKDDDSIRSEAEFLKEVRKIDATYNKIYASAEYNFARHSAQSASKWAEFSASDSKDSPTKDRYYLQYRTANDNHVREAHSTFHNITLPSSDTFWDSHFPPNGWGCRCTVVQVLKDDYKETSQSSKKSIMDKYQEETELSKKWRKSFEFNPGKTKTIYPPNHPYFKFKEEVERAERKKQEKALKKEETAKKEAKEETFETIPTKRGKVTISSKQNVCERQENIEIATFLAEKYDYHYKLLGVEKNQKNPDAYNETLDRYEEFKRNNTPTKYAIDSELKRASKQAKYIVLDIKSDIAEDFLKRGLKGRVLRNINIEEVMVIREGNCYYYKREDILRDDFNL